MTSFESISERLTKVGQSHVLRFWSELSDSEKQEFLQHLSTIDIDGVNELFVKAKNSKCDVEDLDKKMQPIPDSQFESENRCSQETLENYRERGLEEISRGHVGVLLLAGGQGTRLGVDYPKGMLNIHLPSQKTLFQIHAERIRRLQHLAKRYTGRSGKITWYIMTSGPTDEDTEDFFKKHKHFGLDPNDIVMFKQGLLPSFTFDGKIIMEDKNRVAMAPDGNGGLYRALHRNGILEDMQKRNVKYVHVYCVDNILVKIGDPVFIGYCVQKNAECAAKVVRKVEPSEGVGVVCLVNGRYEVVEYSEIPKETSELRDLNSELIFSAGNICNHFFSVDFLCKIADTCESQMKLHVAKKKIKCIDTEGNQIEPEAVNGIKIEKFIFDVFQFADRFVTWEVPRTSEFSAIKNSDAAGKECPSTARRDLLTLHKCYIEKSAGVVQGEEVEISPLVSYAGEDLHGIVAGKIFGSPFHLCSEEEILISKVKGK